MTAKVYANINVDILEWVIEISNLDLPFIAKKTGMSLSTLQGTLDGTKKLTQNQLYNISNYFKRPSLMFYLNTIPTRLELPDFRTLDRPSPEINNKFDIAIRSIYGKKKAAVELFEEIGLHFDYSFLERLSRFSDPEKLGRELRTELNVQTSELVGISDSKVLNFWKNKVEKLGIMVFQFGGIDREISRGFSFSDLPFPIIALNSKETYYARVFTIFHEFTHIILQKSGICDIGIDTLVDDDLAEIEVFCNKVSNAVLTPNSELIREIREKSHLTNESLVIHLSRKFKVSNSVILNNLQKIKKISNAEYDILIEKMKYRPRTPKGSGGPPLHKLELSRNSSTFLNVVMKGIDNQSIPLSLASDYLGVSLKVLYNMERDYKVSEVPS